MSTGYVQSFVTRFTRGTAVPNGVFPRIKPTTTTTTTTTTSNVTVTTTTVAAAAGETTTTAAAGVTTTTTAAETTTTTTIGKNYFEQIRDRTICYFVICAIFY